MAQLGVSILGTTGDRVAVPDEHSLLAFEFWKLCLREDCRRLEMSLAFECLDDECLRVLWATGSLPCVLDIISTEKRVN